MRTVNQQFTKVADGEWVQPVRYGYLMGCCDCGLVHRMNFRIRNGRIQMQAFRVSRRKESLVAKKLKGEQNEVKTVTFPHKPVKAHGEHFVLSGGPRMRGLIVACDGTVTGAQG